MGDGLVHHDVERGDAVAGDQQEPVVVDRVDVTDLAGVDVGQAEIGDAHARRGAPGERRRAGCSEDRFGTVAGGVGMAGDDRLDLGTNASTCWGAAPTNPTRVGQHLVDRCGRGQAIVGREAVGEVVAGGPSSRRARATATACSLIASWACSTDRAARPPSAPWWWRGTAGSAAARPRSRRGRRRTRRGPTGRSRTGRRWRRRHPAAPRGGRPSRTRRPRSTGRRRARHHGQVARTSTARPLTRSDDRVFILCGMADEPTWPACEPLGHQLVAGHEPDGGDQAGRPGGGLTRAATTSKSSERG